MRSVKNEIKQLLFPEGYTKKDYFPVESRCLIAQDQKQNNTWLVYPCTLQLRVLHT